MGPYTTSYVGPGALRTRVTVTDVWAIYPHVSDLMSEGRVSEDPLPNMWHVAYMSHALKKVLARSALQNFVTHFLLCWHFFLLLVSTGGATAHAGVSSVCPVVGNGRLD
jgi:hypothetical protein